MPLQAAYPSDLPSHTLPPQVLLPTHITGETHVSDPRLRGMHERLRELDRKIEHNILDIPPEGARSPSPEPIYDRMGVRLNTREIRYKERLLEERHRE